MGISGSWKRPAGQPRPGHRPGRYRRPYDLVTVEARRGLEAVDILRLRTAIGPVLHDCSSATLGFLVPRGTAKGWDLPGSDCAPVEEQGERYGLFSAGGVRWLLPPHVAAPYTDPVMLRAALGEAAVTIAAADRL